MFSQKKILFTKKHDLPKKHVRNMFSKQNKKNHKKIWSKMVQNCPKWFSIVKNGPIGLKWSNMVQNGTKWSKAVQYGPKL